MRWLLLLAVVWSGAGACRLGGPTDEPMIVPADAGTVADVSAPDEGETNTRGRPDGAEDTPGEDTPGEDTPGEDTPAGGDGSGPSCVPPFVSAVCDPVCNTGCPALSRCDVSEMPRTGACVGLWIGQEGDGCLRGATTDSCATHLTCLDGKCRRLCYRDSDCAGAGTCCTQDIPVAGTSSGFKACTPCPSP